MTSLPSNREHEISPIGYLEIILGPMMSGKTTKGIMIATTKSKRYRTLYVNHDKTDNRETEGGDKSNFTSHNESLIHICKRVHRKRTTDLGRIDVTDYDVVVVDEANFYQDLYDTVKLWVNQLAKYVVVIGLDGSYRQEPFGQILSLIPICDEVRKINAECHICIDELRKEGYSGPTIGIPAPFTKRLANCDQLELIGGAESYTAVCRKHIL